LELLRSMLGQALHIWTIITGIRILSLGITSTEKEYICNKRGILIKSNKPSPFNQKTTPKQKPNASLVSEMLSASEIKQLQQSKKDDNDFFQKAFSQKKNVKYSYFFPSI